MPHVADRAVGNRSKGVSMEWLSDLWWQLKDVRRNSWEAITNRKNVPFLAMVGTIISAMGVMFTWQTSKIANQVSEASQSFAQKVYKDQLLMGAPSISVVSGETVIQEYGKPGWEGEKPTPKYAVSVVLRNSGQRDAKRAWVMVLPSGNYSSDSYMWTAAQLISLPRDVDVPVRFELRDEPSTSQNAKWYVGYVYSDEVPADQPTQASSFSPSGALVTTCSPIQMRALTSWPKNPSDSPDDPTHNAKLRILSSGSPIALRPEDPKADWFDGDQMAASVLTSAVNASGVCPTTIVTPAPASP